MNKLLSITRNIIPYIKELRPVAGSVTAVILWQQLDYWFERSNDSFYKFLSPPEQPHDKYRTGDSWTEELGFSKHEFRTAFDNIGVRHMSKGAFNASENPFIKNSKEYFFCSYHDKQKGLTFYFRNNGLADNALDNLINTGRFTVDKESESTEIKNVNLQKLTNLTSSLYTDTTTETNNNAAEQIMVNNEIIVIEKPKNVVVDVEGFSKEEQPAARKILSAIPAQDQLEVIAVLFAMAATSTITNKIGYLKRIVDSVTNGTFTPLQKAAKQLTAAEQVERQRKQKAKDDARYKVNNADFFADLSKKYGSGKLSGN